MLYWLYSCSESDSDIYLQLIINYYYIYLINISYIILYNTYLTSHA